MKIWAIGDLHLPGGDIKPMDVFGDHWKDHFVRIKEDWHAHVAPEDAVLIPGDISWAMHLSEALDDLREIGTLPGRIVILRGNHDYWWTSVSQLRAGLPPNMWALQNDAVDLGECVVCGTRGWTIPGTEGTDARDEKIYAREAGRLTLSLQAGKQIAAGRPMIAMMHYPPLYAEHQPEGTAFTKLMTEYGVCRCVYGHLHGQGIRRGFNGVHDGVRYDLTSCDALGFRLKDVSL